MNQPTTRTARHLPCSGPSAMSLMLMFSGPAGRG